MIKCELRINNGLRLLQDTPRGPNFCPYRRQIVTNIKGKLTQSALYNFQF